MSPKPLFLLAVVLALLATVMCLALAEPQNTPEELALLASFDDPEMDMSENENFDWSRLVRAARYSSIARCLTYNKPSIQKWNCKWCKDSKTMTPLTDVFVGETKGSEVAWFCGYDATNKEIVCAARSSATIANWLYDLDFAQVAYPCDNCAVHKGFLRSYQDLRHEWLNAIEALSQKYAVDAPLVTITGHSLAAAIATHATLDIGTGKFEKVAYNGVEYWYNTAATAYNTVSAEEHEAFKLLSGAVVTTHTISFPLKLPFYNFGGPRVGNPAFAEHFKASLGNTALYQARRSGDIVPSLPMRTIAGLKFQHPSREIYFPDGTNKYKLCSDDQDEDKKCFLSALHLALTDHLVYAGIPMMQNPLDC